MHAWRNAFSFIPQFRGDEYLQESFEVLRFSRRCRQRGFRSCETILKADGKSWMLKNGTRAHSMFATPHARIGPAAKEALKPTYATIFSIRSFCRRQSLYNLVNIEPPRFCVMREGGADFAGKRAQSCLLVLKAALSVCVVNPERSTSRGGLGRNC